MYGRVTRFELPPDKIEERIQYSHRRGPVLRAFAGFRHAYLLVDRENGQGLTLTLWDSEADMRDSDETAKRIRAESILNLGGRVLESRAFEVVEDLGWEVTQTHHD